MNNGQSNGEFSFTRVYEGSLAPRLVTTGKPVANLVSIENNTAVITVPKATQSLGSACFYSGIAKITLVDGTPKGLPDYFSFNFTPDVLPAPNLPGGVSTPEVLSGGVGEIGCFGYVGPGLPINITKEVFRPDDIEINVTSSNPGPNPGPETVPQPSGNSQSVVFWQNQQTGENSTWLLHETGYIGSVPQPTTTDLNWKIQTITSLGNGKTSIFWQNQQTGENSGWLLEGDKYKQPFYLPKMTDLNWKIKATSTVRFPRLNGPVPVP